MLADISKINEHFAGDEEMIGELLEVFESTYPEVIARLDLAINSQLSDQIKLEAHTLKGMISNFFSEELRLCAYEMESKSTELQVDELNIQLDNLKVKLPILINEIRNAIL